MGFLDSIGGLIGGASSASPWGLAAGLAGGLINGIVGSGQKKQGKKLLKQIGESPNEAVPEDVLANQRMARVNAEQGLPAEQYSQAMRNLQRQQVANMRFAQGRRAPSVGAQTAFNNGVVGLDVANANARLQNQKTLYGINNQVGNWKDKVWNNNVKDVWNRKYQYGQSLLGAGNQNLTTGINQGVAGVLQYGSQGGFGGQAQPGNISADDIAGMQRMPYNPQTLPY